jgi:hypothetical protein
MDGEHRSFVAIKSNMTGLTLASAAVAILMAVGAHAQTSKPMACNGQLIGGPKAQAPTPMTAQLTVNSGKVDVDLGSGNIANQTVSNNNIKLQFHASEFTGAYFHLTGDLFLVYKSGQLARLRCKKAEDQSASGRRTPKIEPVGPSNRNTIGAPF